MPELQQCKLCARQEGFELDAWESSGGDQLLVIRRQCGSELHYKMSNGQVQLLLGPK